MPLVRIPVVVVVVVIDFVGVDIASACDIRLASESAVFGILVSRTICPSPLRLLLPSYVYLLVLEAEPRLFASPHLAPPPFPHPTAPPPPRPATAGSRRRPSSRHRHPPKIPQDNLLLLARPGTMFHRPSIRSDRSRRDGVRQQGRTRWIEGGRGGGC